MLLSAIACLHLAAGVASAREWLEIPIQTTDSFDVYVHDRQSGVFIHAHDGVGATDPRSELLTLGRSERVLAAREGASGNHRWRMFELSDPGNYGRALRADIGEPDAGSWEAA